MAKKTNLQAYADKRDFTVTREPQPSTVGSRGAAPVFVVQEHHASRLHWDFRLEHKGVLLSWAVPKGPSMTIGEKRLAVHVEDHPLDYADFEGTIPAGEYGGGTVEGWDRGTWAPVGDPDTGLRDGDLKFLLDGTRLHGKFVLIRMKPRPKERAENWLLIKERDEPPDASLEKPKSGRPSKATDSPVPPGAVRGEMPRSQTPQLAVNEEAAPDEPGWVNEIKFDGYRMLAFKDAARVRLMTRNGHDWTSRMPTVVAAVAALPADKLLIDGELVALEPSGVSSFGKLQDALSRGDDRMLFFYAFDLLHHDGWDLRPCALLDRKHVLRGLSDWKDTLRFSDHHDGQAADMRRHACKMGLEGIILKRADAPYRAGRGETWRKLKCQGREEFVVLGWTPPAGSRAGLGALHVGYHDQTGRLHYAGGVGTGFSDRELTALRQSLDGLAAERPRDMDAGGEPIDRTVRWVRAKLVAEVQYLAWTDTGRLRHAVYLGLREDKVPGDVIRDPPHALLPPTPKPPSRRDEAIEFGGVRLTHPDRELWPGVTKRALAEYWRDVAEQALPEIAGRPLALVRCPDGIGGEHFFQKHATRGFPPDLRGGEADGAPFITLEDGAGLIACAQMSAVELHAWGAAGADKTHPDRLVFDLDPGEGITIVDLIAAAKDVKARLEAVGLAAFCRTSGGKGLHVLAPIVPRADWDSTRAWCRAFAETMERDAPDRYVASVPKAKRHGRILVDWLRNGLGSTAIASFSPRARPGAGVATRLSWREVTPKLDPAAFNIGTVPARLKKLRADPWMEFAESAKPLPPLKRKT